MIVLVVTVLRTGRLISGPARFGKSTRPGLMPPRDPWGPQSNTGGQYMMEFIQHTSTAAVVSQSVALLSVVTFLFVSFPFSLGLGDWCSSLLLSLPFLCPNSWVFFRPRFLDLFLLNYSDHTLTLSFSLSLSLSLNSPFSNSIRSPFSLSFLLFCVSPHIKLTNKFAEEGSGRSMII